MERIIRESINYLFIVFCIALMAWTSILTVNIMQRILPENPIMPYLSLVLFDLGSLLWFLSFLFVAKGNQRIIAILMLCFDLAGVAIMSIGDIWLSQNFTEIPKQIGIMAVWTVSLSTVINAIAGMYVFHLLDPKIVGIVKEQQRLSDLENLAEQKYASRLNDIADKLADEIAHKRFVDSVNKIRNQNDSSSSVSLPVVTTINQSEKTKQLPSPPMRKRGRPRKEISNEVSLVAADSQEDLKN